PWAGSVRWATLEEDQRIYETGEGEVARFEHDQELLEFRLARLIEHRRGEYVHRGGLFYRRVEDTYPREAVGVQAFRKPFLRRESAPGVFYDFQQIDYRKERF